MNWRLTFLLRTIIFLLLIEASNGHDESKTSTDMMQCLRKLYPSSFKTRQGNPVPNKQVNCSIMPHTGAQHQFDVSTALDPRIKNDRLLFLTVHIQCREPTEIVFNNSHNVADNFTMLTLIISGPCHVSMKNLALWSNVTDFHGLGFKEGKNGRFPKLLKDYAFESEIQSLASLRALSLDSNFPLAILDALSEITGVRSKMAELALTNLSLKRMPEKLQTVMPGLQTLDLRFNKLTQPPIFPWNNTALKFPHGLIGAKGLKVKTLGGSDVDADNYVRSLRLDGNIIQDLSLHEFHGFLHKLSLTRNGLQTIGATSFQNLSGIQAIDISKNNIQELPSQLFHGLNSLTEIQLHENNLSVVPAELFRGSENIMKITLGHNKIRKIAGGLFNSSKRLLILHLEGNRIKTIEEGAFSNSLREVYLQNNVLSYFPISLFRLQNVSKIDLSFNALTFQDLINLVENLDFETDNVSFQETQPKLLDLKNNNFTSLSMQGVKELDALKLSRFLEIYEVNLEGNPLICDCSIIAIKRKIELLSKNYPGSKMRFRSWKCAWPEQMRDKTILETNANDLIKQNEPRQCPEECSCFERCSDQTVVIDCQGRKLDIMPKTLPSSDSIQLNLRNNYIRDIPRHPYLKNLTALYLTHNEIQRLNEVVVDSFERIRILHMDSNNLTTLPRNIENLFLANLALHDNNFDCNCSTKWMKNWLQNLNDNGQVERVENILCKSDSSMEEKAVYILPDERFGCNGTVGQSVRSTNTPNPTSSVITSAVLGTLLAISIIISILVHVYRRELKAIINTHLNRWPFGGKNDSDSTKIYDAFVSYSENDRHWVVNILQERLEKRHPIFKLCIHHRDFEIGTPIVKNILNSVEKSNRMLIVLSRTFLQSEWCMLEFRTAHHKVLEDRLKLIVILFDDVNLDELDGEIKLYLRTNTYLSIKDKWFWEKLIHAMQSNKKEKFRKPLL